MLYPLVENLISFLMIPFTWGEDVPFKHYNQITKILVENGGHFEKMAAISSVQRIARAVHPEVVQKGLPNTLIPNNLFTASHVRLTKKCGVGSLGNVFKHGSRLTWSAAQGPLRWLNVWECSSPRCTAPTTNCQIYCGPVRHKTKKWIQNEG